MTSESSKSLWWSSLLKCLFKICSYSNQFFFKNRVYFKRNNYINFIFNYFFFQLKLYTASLSFPFETDTVMSLNCLLKSSFSHKIFLQVSRFSTTYILSSTNFYPCLLRSSFNFLFSLVSSVTWTLNLMTFSSHLSRFFFRFSLSLASSFKESIKIEESDLILLRW